MSLEKLGPGLEGVFEGGEKVCVIIRAREHDTLERPILGFLLRDRLSQDMFGENTLSFTSTVPRPVKPGQEFTGEFVFRLPMLPNGHYFVMASLPNVDQYNNVQHHYLHDAFIFNVSSSKNRFGLGGIPFERVAVEVCND